MAYLLAGVAVGSIIAVYYLFKQNLLETDKKQMITCDRTEQKGFYSKLDPRSLPTYQSALNSAFDLLGVMSFYGEIIPHEKKDAIKQWALDAKSIPGINIRYLEVMLWQFLHTCPAVRRQEGIAERWATLVYEQDQPGDEECRHEVPSAWKVYFNHVFFDK